LKKAALYARVSTDSQAEKELSIPAQIKELKEYADKHEMKVVKKGSCKIAFAQQIFENLNLK